MVASLGDYRTGQVHPEYWVRGTEHPTLPPRLPLWNTPRMGEALPFPSECQLNPFLEHTLFGSTPLLWDLRNRRPLYPRANVDTDPLEYLSPADSSQPATWPFVTHLYINAIADESVFPWPIMVTNPCGVKCRDIFNAVWRTFQEPMSQDEINSLSKQRRKHSFLTYHSQGVGDRPKHLIRLDYLCQRTRFRGLEPNPNGEGWVMFLGFN